MTETQRNFLNKVSNTVFKSQNAAEISDAVLNLARSQNMYHLMGVYDDEYHKNLMHIFRTEEAIRRICSIFENAGIEYVPIKGAVIRNLYPEPWMRSSCDIDVLVHEKDVDRACSLLAEAGGLVAEKRGKHDVQITVFDITLELHFTLNYGEDNILDSAWEHVTYGKFDEAFFYYYIISHMKKHFICGATGVRSILDLQFVPRNHTLTDGTANEKFASMCEKLSDVWFKGEAADDDDLELFGDMILRGGTIVNTRQRSEISRVRNGAGTTLKSRLFLPYSELVRKYPSLEKRKWMLPLYEIKRVFDMICAGRLGAKVREFGYITKNDPQRDEKIEKLLKKIGIEI